MTEITRGQFVAAALAVVVVGWFAAHALGAPRPGEAGVVPPVVGMTASRGEPGTVPGGAAAVPVAGGPGEAVSGTVVVRRPAGRKLVVHVAGAVRRPGVYGLRDGQRVADAVRRAGGATRSADLDAINLAVKVRDGVQILVPRRGTPPAGAAGPAAPAATGVGGGGAGSSGATVAGDVLDLNAATAEQLETLDGVGPATSAKILQFRAAHGPFRSVDDLELIPGIGPKKLAAMRPRLRV